MMKADVERADHDGLEDDPEVLGVTHVEEELGMGQAREDPQLLGESTPAALPDGEPLPSPLVGPHVSLVTGSEAREERVLLQGIAGDQHPPCHPTLYFLLLFNNI